ncbi:BapA/Bap/LapF family prefix-like domain-containing protein, partial [Diaphorobacter sp.]|uniref:BapA/Bap/LapF family prefix-like domain-containing protein n=1 Tax=Diaphorobacter sp. TaxID=1934310 RepID=UPI0028B0ABA3
MVASTGSVDITVVSKKTSVSMYGVSNDFTLRDASVVQLGVTRADVRSMVRDGDDLIIELANGDVITVRDFFANLDGGRSHLVLQDELEGLWLAEFVGQDGSMAFGYSHIYSIEPLLVAESSNAALPIVGLWAGGLAALLAAGASSGSRGDDRPAQAKVNPVNDKNPITGSADPGSTVVVTFPDGSTASAKAGGDGKFKIQNPGLKDGDKISVVVVNGDAESDKTIVTVDANAPDVPDVDPNNGKDPITGKAEPDT